MSSLLTRYVYHNIYVQSDDMDFLEKVKNDLNRIESKEVGCRLIHKISKGERAVFIFDGAGKRGGLEMEDPVSASTRGWGCSSIITYSLEDHIAIDSMGKIHVMPSFLTLAHELIHAYHASYGKIATSEQFSLNEYQKYWWTSPEEMHAIRGFPSAKLRSKPKITENTIRQEHGYPERFGHINAEDSLKNPPYPVKLAAQSQRIEDVFFKNITQKGKLISLFWGT